MKHPNPILNKDYQKIWWIFNLIAYKLGGKLSRNPTFDERGLTDLLLDLMQTSFKHTKLSKYYINLHSNKPSEKKTGADILFRIKINREDISFDRYVLFQAKKYLSGKSQYSETDLGNKHLTSQVEKMHNYNPEFSYLLLYANNDEPIANFVESPNKLSPSLFWGFHPHHLEMYLEDILHSGEFYTSANFQDNYPVTILRAKTWQKLSKTNADILLKYSETLPNFMLDDFLNGKIGKDWDDSIEQAQGEFSIIVTLNISQG